MSNNYSGRGNYKNNNNNFGGRGRGSGRGNFRNNGGRGRGNNFKRNHHNNNNKENRDTRKGLSFDYKEPKETKELKISLGATSSEKVNIPIYDDHSRHETMFILIKRFNIMVDDGDLFFENTGLPTRCEANTANMTAAQKAYKLNKIKEVYRTFRSCLLGKAREKWLKVLENAPEFDPVNNYEPDNVLSVEGFEDYQKELVESLFEDELIENTKAFLINTPKPRNLNVEDYVSRVETINNYIPYMAVGAVKYTEREMIRSVIMQRVPSNWRCSLLRAGNNNVTTIEALVSKLVPIETADNEEQKRKHK